MKNKKQRIALFGGTFAPPHLGHVHAVRTLSEHIDVDRIIIMPTFMPPHKVKVKGDTPELRLEMCRAAFGDIDKAYVSDYEIEKGGVSYTVHTLEYLTGEYDADIYLLCGTDMFLTLDTWFCAERIFSLAKIVCIPRYSENIDFLNVKKQEYEDEFGAEISIIGGDPFEVSSTEIRRLITEGGDLSEYLPSGVIEIIRREKLYNESEDNG